LLFRRLLSFGCMVSIAVAAASSQPSKIDPAFLGFWDLDVAKSEFAGQPKPKSGQVNWGEHGWAFALVLADGQLFTDAAMTDHGCIYVGKSRLTCEYEILTPRHVRLRIRAGKNVVRVGDIELLNDTVTQTTHRVMPPDGAPYVEKTIWTKQK
jgi:hypothetical protein